MDVRLPALLQHFERQGTQLSWVVILGGTNDLGYRAGPDAVYAGLQSLYAACRGHGARVLALTVLQNAGSHAGSGVDDRTRLNELIRGTPSLPGYEHVTVLDVDTRLPYPRSRADFAANALWDDSLHLTPAGYDTLGTMVYDALQAHLEK